MVKLLYRKAFPSVFFHWTPFFLSVGAVFYDLFDSCQPPYGNFSGNQCCCFYFLRDDLLRFSAFVGLFLSGKSLVGFPILAGHLFGLFGDSWGDLGPTGHTSRTFLL